MIYLVRHGRTTGEGLLLGASDVDLSAHGRAEAARLADELCGKGVRQIVSSALARAVQTAGILEQRLTCPVRRDARLNEISYGEWDGRAWSDIEAAAPEMAAAKLVDWWNVAPPGGETAGAFLVRIAAAWRDICSGPQPAVVVAHAAVNSLLCELARTKDPAKIDWDRMTTFDQGCGTSIELEIS